MFAQLVVDATLLVYSLLVGAVLAVLYDFLKLVRISVFPYSQPSKNQVRRLIENGNTVSKSLYGFSGRVSAADVLCFFTDIIFFVTSALTVIILLFHLNYGRVRMFSLVSAITGFTVYKLTVGKPLFKILAFLINYAKKTIARALGILLRPIIKALNATASPLLISARARARKSRTRKILAKMERNENLRRAKRVKKSERN